MVMKKKYKNSEDSKPFLGVVEGYYGQLLTFVERQNLLEHACVMGVDFYLYAPKEDPYHRSSWEKPYPPAWANHLKKCARVARYHQVDWIVGLSPMFKKGWSSVKWKDQLQKKTVELLRHNPAGLALLFDDIPLPKGDRVLQGKKLARLHLEATQLVQAQISQSCKDIVIYVCTPFYSQIPWQTDPMAQAYHAALGAQLPSNIVLWWTGENVISKDLEWQSFPDTYKHSSPSMAFWDNRYARDYAPDRLSVGPYPVVNQSFKKSASYLAINLTGMLFTDKLLTAIFMGAGNVKTELQAKLWWRVLMDQANLPAEFFKILPWLDSPWKKPQLPASLKECDELIHICWKCAFNSDLHFSKHKIKGVLPLADCTWESLRLEWFSAFQSLRRDLYIYREKMFDRPFPYGDLKKSGLLKNVLASASRGVLGDKQAPTYDEDNP